ncbi:MAG: 4Fe-4S dicluster domain-containing protein [Chloroflexota bacterium]|nr:4Fe-4S dicluster domain-containing protein [Chloroflexota bacterium]
MSNENLRESIIRYARENGADLIGFAGASMWDELNEVPPAFRPVSIWSETKTVIVMGVTMLLPIVETTPSIVHTEMYRTCNRELDSLAFNLARELNRQGYPSIFFPRDGFGDITILREQPVAAFSQVMAAKYAGLGTIGLSHNLLTPDFGPRVRFVSVFTSAKIEPDTMLREELCIKCMACAECCPVKAITPRESQVIGGFDARACTEQHVELTKKKCYPCGICTKVCPIGQDRKLYQKGSGNVAKYRKEAKALAANSDDPNYKSWVHMRRYGRWP